MEGIAERSRKILPLDTLPAWRRELRQRGQTLVATNGCFDLLHVGHVTYLEAARQHGDLLLVGLNSDTSVRQLKGPGRPVNPEADRALLLAALEVVDAISIFPDLRATRFLELAQPDVYVKGGDITRDQIPIEERRAVEGQGGRILVMPVVAGRSTSALLRKIQSL